MLKNYLKIALRNLRNHKGYALINITGLAVGIACCLLILLYVQDERAFDRFHEKADRIYRVIEDQDAQDVRAQGLIRNFASTPSALAPLLGDDFPGLIENIVRFYPGPGLVSRGEVHKYEEAHFFFADSTVFEVFTFPFLHGNPETALDAPFSLVLTASMARKYFGDEDPVGQTLQYDGAQDFEVTGVMADVPQNAHFSFDFLASFASLNTLMPWVVQDWHYPPMYTYVALAPGVDPASLTAQLPDFVARHGDEETAQQRIFSLQPLTDIRLHSHREEELAANGDIAYLYIFSAIALFILLIASINFMNLTTARSARRAKEVGMRKVLGARRFQLVRQFLSESVLQAILALVLAIVLIELMMPVFNEVSGKALSFSLLGDGSMLLTMGGIVLVVGMLAGFYPAFYLSAFRPVKVMKGGTTTGGGLAARLRKGLVIFQFAISCTLIIGTAVVYQQLDYLRNQKALGFDKEHVVVVSLRDYQDQTSYERIKTLWLQNPAIVSVSATSGVPGQAGVSNYPIVPEGGSADQQLRMFVLAADHDFAQTFGVEIDAGRTFSADFPADTSSAFLLNAMAAQQLGWADPIDKKMTLRYDHPSLGFVPKEGRIVGVMQDFHFNSLHRAIDPLLVHIVPPSWWYDYLSVRIRPEDMAETLAFLEAEWNAFSATGRPFEYVFLDQAFDALYRTEEQFGKIFGYFSMLAILIACLGLFGLASFTAEQRTKEIGVRKVMGASIGGIVILLSTDFLKLVGLAFVLAVPVAYLAMTRWLSDFAYHIEPGVLTFVGAGAAALAIALLTVSYQAIRAALANPVDALHYE